MSCKTFNSIIKSLFIQQRPISTLKFPKKAWTLQESKKLIDLVEIHGTDWIIIQQYFTDRGRKSIGGRYHFMMQKSSSELKTLTDTGVQLRSYETWTKNEDALLLALVKEHGLQWTKISRHFSNRGVSAVLQRYNRLLEGTLIQRGPWTKEENTTLQSLLNIYGQDFKKIASILKSRTVDQCRARIKYMINLPVTIESLSTSQIDSLKKAAEMYGTDDFQLLIKRAKLPSALNHEDARKYYWRELDPTIVTSDWTKDQVISMIHLYNELDGCMELVQTRLPVKRSLKDMWIRYHDHILNA